METIIAVGKGGLSLKNQQGMGIYFPKYYMD